jgi:hypothetical protein
VNELLQNKVEQQPTSSDSREKLLRKTDKQLNEDYANLMRLLSSFLDEYYNPEDDEGCDFSIFDITKIETESQKKKSQTHSSLKYFLQVSRFPCCR